MAAEKLPKFVVLKGLHAGGYLYYNDQDGPARGQVRVFGRSVFDPLAKIELERSKDHPGYLHLRFVHTNKYWSMPHGETIVYAYPDQPDENLSDSSCTLFRLEIMNDGNLRLFHPRFERPLVQASSGLSVGPVDLDPRHKAHAFEWANAEELVQLPQFVAFKGDNGKYLKSVQWSYPYLQFSSDDPNMKDSAHEVQHMPNGHIRLRSIHLDKFSRLSPSWIWCDSTDEYNEDTWFKAVRTSDGKIVLKSAGNGRFCRRLTRDGKDDCLNAFVDSMTKETKLEAEALVSESKSYNVRFRTEFSRVYDETPDFVGDDVLENYTDSPADMTAKVSTTIKNTETVTNSISGTLAGKTKFNIGPNIVKLGEVEITISLTGTRTWGETKETSTTKELSTKVTVPPRTKAVCKCIGTKGTCNVPFSYTQEDKSSLDGKINTTEHIDGIYTSLRYYKFQFDVPKFVPL